MTPWYEIYKERMNERYLEHVANKYAPFIERVHAQDASTLVEIGCGAGTITRILREMREETGWYTLVDNCPKMLGLAVENNPTHRALFKCQDIRWGWFSDDRSHSAVVHSHGVLEHFGDEDIRKIVDLSMRSGHAQVHYVPGAKYETPSRGDERLMTPEQWDEILSGFKRRISTFNDGYDIIIEIGHFKR